MYNKNDILKQSIAKVRKWNIIECGVVLWGENNVYMYDNVFSFLGYCLSWLSDPLFCLLLFSYQWVMWDFFCTIQICRIILDSVTKN